MDNSYDSEGFDDRQTDEMKFGILESLLQFLHSADTDHCCSLVYLYKYLPAKRDSFSFRIEEVACANIALILLMAET